MPRAHNFKDRKGEIFGRLTVIELSKKSKPKKIYWKCLCQCGNIIDVLSNSLISGNTKSCGCLRSELVSNKYSTHKKSTSSEYYTYYSMISRCYNKNNNVYQYYGGRGIKVCDRWLKSFENFYKDMGDKPSPKHSIDRINNNGDYEPNNCKWATQSEQTINSRHVLGQSGYRYIHNIGKGYRVELTREGNVRRSLVIRDIKNAVKIRDEWVREYEENKNTWIEKTKNKTYKRKEEELKE